MVMKYSGDNLAFPDNSVQYSAAYLPFRNRIINGDMRIDQRRNGASFTPTSGDYLVDRFFYGASQASKFTAGQNLGAIAAPTGFSKYLGFSVASAYTAAATEQFRFGQAIEGLNVADFGFGTASAMPIAVSFMVRSSIAGTHSGSVQNYNATRSYPFAFTINSANTWEQKVLLLPGDTSGTWNTDISIGLFLQWNLGSGTNLLGPAGAWAAADYRGVSGAVPVVGTAGATFYITGVQLEPLLSLSSTATPFERVDYSEMLRRCQRYYETFTFTIGRAYSATQIDWGLKYSVTKRSGPSYSVIKPAHTVAVAGGATQTSSGSSVISGVSSVTGGFINVSGYTGLTAGMIMVPYDSGDICAASAEL